MGREQLNASSPGVDAETRLSSTFEMLRNACSVHTVLNAFPKRILALSSLSVTDEQWIAANLGQDFLEPSASITITQSWSFFASISISLLAFQSFVLKCEKALLEPDPVFDLIATAIKQKLEEY